MDQIDQAKELFLKYGGSFFYMDREGEYERYKGYGVSKELEETWLQEWRIDLLRVMDGEDDGVKLRLAVGTLVDSIWNRGDYAQVYPMLEIIKRKALTMDSFSQVLVAEALAKLVDSCKERRQERAMVGDIVAMATEILEQVVGQPVKVAPTDLECAWLNEVIQPHRIVERAQQCLSRMRR